MMTTFSELLGTYGADLFWLVIKIGALVLGLLIFVAYLTYAERKILAMMQLRQGPMTVGPFGLLQPFADAFK
ncbi:MAG: NADH-quinone oxidoreductase subunit H, partial [Alphaproteobacteria bacterium]|nr:NADH-quinone oxidoreductase subunit H [Alphaproteobacteria bacterium]